MLASSRSGASIARRTISAPDFFVASEVERIECFLRADECDAACELGEALLELLAVVIAGGFFDLAADLVPAEN